MQPLKHQRTHQRNIQARSRKQRPRKELTPCPTRLKPTPMPCPGRRLTCFTRSGQEPPPAAPSSSLLPRRAAILRRRRIPSVCISSPSFLLCPHFPFFHGPVRKVHICFAARLSIPAQPEKNLFIIVPALPKRPAAAVQACLPFTAADSVSVFRLPPCFPWYSGFTW